MLIRGQCHCGNIAFTLDWEPAPREIQARECGCSFCRKHRGVWTSNPNGHLRIRIAAPQALHRYAFGTRTAEFLVCARCGVVPAVTSRIDGRTYAVVNVNSFEDLAHLKIHRSSADFEGEETDNRLARRKRHWIARVSFDVPADDAPAAGSD